MTLLRIEFSILRCVVLAALQGVIATTSLAGTGTPIKSPNPRIPSTTGIQLTVDPYWVEGRGYRPVRVVAFASTLANYDRTISITFYADEFSRVDRKLSGISVTQEFVLPENAQSASTTIAVPQYTAWNRMGWTVFVDGDLAKELGVEWIDGPSGSSNWQEQVSRVLYVNLVSAVRRVTDAPLRRQRLQFRLPASEGATDGVNQSLYSDNAAGIGIRELPVRWIDYSCLDIVQVPSTEFQLLVKQNPQAWRAIRQWVATGGNLVIEQFPFGPTGNDPSGLQAVDTALIQNDGRSPSDDSRWRSSVETSPDDRDRPQQRPLEIPFRWRPYQIGTVTVAGGKLSDLGFRYEDFSDGDIEYGGAVYEESMPENSARFSPPDYDRQTWAMRHGLEPYMGTSEFWNFLIPGVGLAPVGAFRILITLFVIAIGPVNYYFLRRWRRNHLLVFTIPVCAGAVTFALFGYALISDGLGTRVRVRSFTEIDQRTGEAACISRQSYYSGLAPGDGLSFPNDAMVVPIVPPARDARRWMGGGVLNDLRAIDWDDRQNLTDGWLASRTPTQYLIVRSRSTPHALDVKFQNGGVSVANQLGTRVQYLVVCDSDGNIHWGENIEVGGGSRLTAIEGPEAVSKFDRVFSDNHPEYPSATTDGDYDDWRSLSDAYGDGQLEMAHSRLEQSLRDYGPSYAGRPRSRTYLAVVENSPEVELGVEAATVEGSLHVILGKY
ncbi:MAG: hypothetical protein VX988_00240 [Planctomycetota bacterium]|nr:hypothetical protein [Planctomycetota bacterium]